MTMETKILFNMNDKPTLNNKRRIKQKIDAIQDKINLILHANHDFGNECNRFVLDVLFDYRRQLVNLLFPVKQALGDDSRVEMNDGDNS